MTSRRFKRRSGAWRFVALTAGMAVLASSALAQPDSASKVSPAKSGKDVYDAVCTACHTTGALNAPRLGDTRAWGPLIREGRKALVKTAINGIRQMPPKGGNAALSPVEVERAVVYLANASGAKFKEAR